MYQIIDSFSAGLDTRKSPLTSPAGALTRLVNAVITPGGEISKRRAFIKVADLPSNSFGLASTESRLVIFGKNATPTAPVIPGFTVTVLKVPNADPGLVQFDHDVFDGKIYLAAYAPAGGTAEFKNPHYYDTGDVGGTMAVTEGSGKGYYVRTYQSKIYAVLGKYLYFSAIDDPMTWETIPASSPLTTPPAAPAGIPVLELDSGNDPNVTVATAYDGHLTDGQRVTFSGADASHAGANGTWPIQKSGAPGVFSLLGPVNPGGAPQTSGTMLIKSPSPAAAGQGYINLSLQDAASDTLTSLEVYYDKLAIFSSAATQIWAVDPDPLQNAFLQLLRGNGTTAPRSPLQYGSGDVQYLDQSGIRSLKARDSSNSAAVSDIGSPVDPTIQALRLLKGASYMNKAISVLEPSVGRFWMIFPDRVLALSFFPGPKVTAWSEFSLPELGGALVQHVVTCQGKIFIRSTDNKLYVYGGLDGLAYNNCGVEVRLPYLDGRKPGHKKLFQAIDATVSGTWRVAVSFDFDNPDAEENLATLTKPTWNVGASELQGYDSHFSLRFYNEVDGPATVSNCAVHYEMGASEE